MPKTFLLILITTIAHLLASIFSVGYHHPDEHYQVLEFANAYLGRTPFDVLPWEYSAQIRPWLQPLGMAAFYKGLTVLGITSGVDWALYSRILYSLLNLFSLYALSKAMPDRSKTSQTIFWFTAATLWFLPYVHARTSAENLSGILFTFALAKELFALKSGSHNSLSLQSGFLFGLSFVVRPQMALAGLGIGMARLFQAQIQWKKISFLALGFFCATAIGVVADRIGYGTWVFTPLRYFDVNLVQGVAATFNPYPWYQYFLWLLELHPLVNICIVTAFILIFRKNKTDPSILAAAAFFILHMMLTNKEYRFLFPLVNLIPLWFAQAFSHRLWIQRHSMPLAIVWVLINFPAYFVSSLRASAFKVWPYIAAHSFEASDSPEWISNLNFRPDPSSSFRFYDVPGKALIPYGTADDLRARLGSLDGPNYVMLDVLYSDPAREGIIQALAANECMEKASAIPTSLLHPLATLPFGKKLHQQSVYFCKSRSN